MIALVTCEKAILHDTDLPLLGEELEKRQCLFDVVFWDDPDVNWNLYSHIIIRSTWNYCENHEAFIEWAKQREQHATLFNNAAILRWNTEKTYLGTLQKNGIPTIPSHFFYADQDLPKNPLDNISCDDTVDEIVIKPTISSGSRDTDRYKLKDESAMTEAHQHICRLLNNKRNVLVQPYLPAVESYGETALLFFGGKFSHAICKSAMLSSTRTYVDDLYVEETITQREPTSAERELAEQTLHFVQKEFGTPLYARIDVIPDHLGKPRVLEVELTEPSLFLNTSANSASFFADVIVEATR